MIKAVDASGKLYSVWQADRAQIGELFCPFCNGRVFARHCQDRDDHFYHQHETHECLYEIENPMTPWHLSWQARFPEECREVIVTHNGEKHIADVMIGDLVVEFQHSNMDIGEFMRRNEFYRAQGYSVIWVFDLIKAWDKEYISSNGEGGYEWSNPPALFRSICNRGLEDVGATIYVQFDDDRFSVVERVKKIYMDFKLFYLDDKRIFTREEFVRLALHDQGKLFYYNASPSAMKRAHDEGGKTIAELWDPKYRWIQVQSIEERPKTYYLYGRRIPPHELLCDPNGKVQGRVGNGDQLTTIYDADLPKWKIIKTKLR